MTSKKPKLGESYESYLKWKDSLSNFHNLLPDTVPGGMDIDGLLHRGLKESDHFLVIELKPPGQKMGRGQHRCLSALQQLPNMTVVVIYGPDSKGKYLLSWDWHGLVTETQLKKRIGGWWDSRE